MERIKFYENFVKKKITNKDAKIVVFGAGENDIKIFKNLGFNKVTFTNLNSNNNQTEKINIHENQLDNELYDYSVTNASIHHSSKPHLAILEMYRVSKKGVLIIEANDSLIVRAAVKLNFAEEFEISAVKSGSTGVDDTNIPNYIYRWTEREIYKLINSYKPNIIHKIDFEYTNHLRLSGLKSFIIKIILRLIFKLFIKQQNIMGIFIDKEAEINRYS